MKKIIFLSMAAILLLMSCATASIDGSIHVSGDDIARLSAKASASRSGIKDVCIQVENISGEAMLIDWSRSTMTYKGVAYPVVIKGQAYAKADQPMPSTVVLPGESYSTELHASRQITRMPYGWAVIGIPGGTTLNLFIGNSIYTVELGIYR